MQRVDGLERYQRRQMWGRCLPYKSDRMIVKQGLALLGWSGHVEWDGCACNPILHVPKSAVERDPDRDTRCPRKQSEGGSVRGWRSRGVPGRACAAPRCDSPPRRGQTERRAPSAERGVVVADQEAQGHVVRRGLARLLDDPGAGRAPRHVDVYDTARSQAHDEEGEERTEARRIPKDTPRLVRVRCDGSSPLGTVAGRFLDANHAMMGAASPAIKQHGRDWEEAGGE
jgi:hypothetical protein